MNFEAEITFSCSAAIDTNFGIMLRASHYSDFSSQPAQSWRGYYLQLGMSMVAIKRYDYGDTGSLAVERTGDVDLTTGERHTAIIRAEEHRLTVVLDGAITLTAEDPCAFFAGGLGIYAGKGEFIVHAIKYNRTEG